MPPPHQLPPQPPGNQQGHYQVNPGSNAQAPPANAYYYNNQNLAPLNAYGYNSFSGTIPQENNQSYSFPGGKVAPVDPRKDVNTDEFKKS